MPTFIKISAVFCTYYKYTKNMLKKKTSDDRRHVVYNRFFSKVLILRRVHIRYDRGDFNGVKR